MDVVMRRASIALARTSRAARAPARPCPLAPV